MALMTIMCFLQSSSGGWAHKVLWGKNVMGQVHLENAAHFLSLLVISKLHPQGEGSETFSVSGHAYLWLGQCLAKPRIFVFNSRCF